MFHSKLYLWLFQELDICTCCTKDLEFTSPFHLNMQREGNVTAIMGYFDIDFSKGTKKVSIFVAVNITQVLGTGQVKKGGPLLRHIPVLDIYVSAPPPPPPWELLRSSPSVTQNPCTFLQSDFLGPCYYTVISV